MRDELYERIAAYAHESGDTQWQEGNGHYDGFDHHRCVHPHKFGVSKQKQ